MTDVGISQSTYRQRYDREIEKYSRTKAVWNHRIISMAIIALLVITYAAFVTFGR